MGKLRLREFPPVARAWLVPSPGSFKSTGLSLQGPHPSWTLEILGSRGVGRGWGPEQHSSTMIGEAGGPWEPGRFRGDTEKKFANLYLVVGVSQVRRTTGCPGQGGLCGRRRGGVIDDSVSGEQALYAVLLAGWKMWARERGT